jgi:hypothetical protein
MTRSREWDSSAALRMDLRLTVGSRNLMSSQDQGSFEVTPV